MKKRVRLLKNRTLFIILFLIINKADVMQDDKGYKNLEKMAKENNIEIFNLYLFYPLIFQLQVQ